MALPFNYMSGGHSLASLFAGGTQRGFTDSVGDMQRGLQADREAEVAGRAAADTRSSVSTNWERPTSHFTTSPWATQREAVAKDAELAADPDGPSPRVSSGADAASAQPVRGSYVTHVVDAFDDTVPDPAPPSSTSVPATRDRVNALLRRNPEDSGAARGDSLLARLGNGDQQQNAKRTVPTGVEASPAKRTATGDTAQASGGSKYGEDPDAASFMRETYPTAEVLQPKPSEAPAAKPTAAPEEATGASGSRFPLGGLFGGLMRTVPVATAVASEASHDSRSNRRNLAIVGGREAGTLALNEAKDGLGNVLGGAAGLGLSVEQDAKHNTPGSDAQTAQQALDVAQQARDALQGSAKDAAAAGEGEVRDSASRLTQSAAENAPGDTAEAANGVETVAGTSGKAVGEKVGENVGKTLGKAAGEAAGESVAEDAGLAAGETALAGIPGIGEIGMGILGLATALGAMPWKKPKMPNLPAPAVQSFQAGLSN